MTFATTTAPFRGYFRSLSLSIFLLAACSWMHTLTARPVTTAETQKAAQHWLYANPHLLRVSGDASLTDITTASGQILLRKVLYPSGGALLITADTRLPPILAILSRGRISPTHPLIRHLKADVIARLKELPDTDDAAWAPLLAEQPPAPAIQPLYVFDAERWDGELNHWNQESFNRYGQWEEGTLYNRYTPEHYMAGCVAIAGSAIQQFYAFPTEQAAYTNAFCAVYDADLKPQFRPLQTRPGPYHWEILPKSWQKNQPLTEEQRELIARIAANSGVITGTHYAATASGGSTYFLMEGLRSGAGYATGMEYCPTPTTPMTPFLSGLLYAQLRCGAPCVLDLGGKAGNHAVVATGIAEDHQPTTSTRLFYGWGGSGDAWYALPSKGSFHGILGIGTLVSTDGACIPITGTLLQQDGTPAAHHPITIAGTPHTTDGAGRFATRIAPTPSVTIRAGTHHTTLTLNADLLHRATTEPWATPNPNAVTTDT
ncbi:MAG: C10 family peptidase, partial [Kiritimatiellae bacterium]|nr:C10 family peptidase [Kiritimatiellia bacterium]